MPSPKPKGGRPKQEAEFHEGPDASKRFMRAIKTVLSVPKEKIVELEQASRKPLRKA